MAAAPPRMVAPQPPRRVHERARDRALTARWPADGPTSLRKCCAMDGRCFAHDRATMGWAWERPRANGCAVADRWAVMRALLLESGWRGRVLQMAAASRRLLGVVVRRWHMERRDCRDRVRGLAPPRDFRGGGRRPAMLRRCRDDCFVF
ncbi:hypothetical protein F511_46152 [Dorcoceras hygrometricum]|uniref:Uncharacterized protein n=1 Tax=Dorcoceras hygrometricum TaxID=472368 RepID=A0A2Z7A190_9LAMI|nr:hypothetical protein F511_46152 [Dorcoceras hygrometricum]